MSANRSAPQWSSVLAAEGHGSSCEVRRERTPGTGIHSEETTLTCHQGLREGEDGSQKWQIPGYQVTIFLLCEYHIQSPVCFNGHVMWLMEDMWDGSVTPHLESYPRRCYP